MGIQIEQRIPTETKDWVRSESARLKQSVDDDMLIDAHLSGIEKGLSRNEEPVQKAFEDNLQAALKLTGSLFKKDLKPLKPSDMFMRVLDITSFEVLILVDTEQYLNAGKRKSLYNKLQDVTRETESNTFHLSFSVAPKTENTNIDLITADGFFLRYSPESRKA